MNSRAATVFITSACLASIGACRTEHAPPSTPTSATSWRLEVAAQNATGFGARMFLDGEEVYLAPSVTLVSHRAEFVRPYVQGQHVLEVEIVASASTSPALYIASCTAQVTPSGKALHADGVPWNLSVGQRLRLSVSPE